MSQSMLNKLLEIEQAIGGVNVNISRVGAKDNTLLRSIRDLLETNNKLLRSVDDRLRSIDRGK